MSLRPISRPTLRLALPETTPRNFRLNSLICFFLQNREREFFGLCFLFLRVFARAAAALSLVNVSSPLRFFLSFATLPSFLFRVSCYCSVSSFFLWTTRGRFPYRLLQLLLFTSSLLLDAAMHSATCSFACQKYRLPLSWLLKESFILCLFSSAFPL